ncbi:MAG: stalk domain-containing protein [Caldisericia bacterium]
MWRKKLFTLVLISVFVLASNLSDHSIVEIIGASQPCSWPTYGKDAGRTSHQYGEGCYPEDDKLVLSWKKQLNTFYKSSHAGSVIVDSNRLFACTQIGSVHCLSTYDGKSLWEYRGYRNIDVTPVLYDNMLFCLTSNKEKADFGNLFSLDSKTGELKWHTDLSDTSLGLPRIPVTAWNGIVFVLINGDTENMITFVDSKTGKIIWKKHFDDDGGYVNFSTPVFYDDYMIVAINRENNEDVIRCYSLKEYGRIEWEINDVSAENITKVGSRLIFTHKYKRLSSFNLKKMEFEWTIDDISAREHISHANGFLYFVNNKEDADYLTCMRLTNGKITWEKKIPESEECCNNGVITIAGGKLYTGNVNKFGLRSFSSSNGDILWEYIDKECEITDWIYPRGYVVVDGKLFVSYAGYVYCFSDPDPPIPTSIEVTPDKTHLLEPGESLQFIATIHDQYPELDRIISEDELDEKITWSVTPTSLGTIDDNGLFTASILNGGLGTITARLDSYVIEGTATLQIRSPQPAEIECDPTEIVLEDIDPTGNNPSVKVTLSNVGEMLTDVRLDCKDDWLIYPEGYKRIYPAQSMDIDIEFDLSKVDFSLVEDETLHSKIYVYWDKHERVIPITIGLINIPEPEPEPIPEPEPNPDPDPEPNPEEPKTITLTFKIDQKSYILNDEVVETDSEPVIQNGRTLLPARFVTEPLGGDVGWESTEKKVVCTLGETTVEMWIGKLIAKINGEEVQIDPDNPDVVPTIINDRTMVPMRFLAESLGCEVEWVAESREIILTYNR